MVEEFKDVKNKIQRAVGETGNETAKKNLHWADQVVILTIPYCVTERGIYLIVEEFQNFGI